MSAANKEAVPDLAPDPAPAAGDGSAPPMRKEALPARLQAALAGLGQGLRPQGAGAGSEAVIASGGEAPAASARETRSGVWGPIVVTLALVAAIGTFLFLMGALGIEPQESTGRLLLAFDLVLIVILLAIVFTQLWRLGRESRRGMAGARLHRRVVGLFSLVAAVPTTLVAGAALFSLDRGLTPWFSGDLRALVQNAEVISQNFQQQMCQNMGREMRLMASDLDRAGRAGVFARDRAAFEQILTSRATALGFPYAEIFSSDGTLIERANISARPFRVPNATPEDFSYAGTEEPPCLFSNEAVGGLIQLRGLGQEAYLMVARAVDRRALEFPLIARSGVVQYQLLESRRNATQLAIAIVFALLTLIGLLGAVLLGLGFADRLVDPVRRLMQATDQVSAGNLYVQVPLSKMSGDFGQLGATFNNMTTVLREQHNSLSAANELIDQRRRFMEAVLAGVPAGVMGLNAEGIITLINPTARQILDLPEGEGLDQEAAVLLPEIAPFLADARTNPQKLSQRELPLIRRGRERILSVRATGDASGGLVVTLDDISDLVTAQRSSAWADVARRIAHEIKNPLTPIQLSAERIRRKFGKVIVEDHAIFEQCTDTIVRQVDDIKRMVDEFSSFARMPKPLPAEEDLVAVLREVLFLMRVGNPDITFDDQLPETGVKVRIDRRLIAQAVQNLLKNACEAIAEAPAGQKGEGRIILRLAPAAPGLNEVVFELVDNGKGFPATDRQKLLEPYVTTREGGTGLGLPIVAKIFEDHGGRIELLDRPAEAADDPPAGGMAQGALVRVHLPSLQTQAAPGGAPATRGQDQPAIQAQSKGEAAWQATS